jgi:putative SOS response-associated peptidase YedK
MAPIHNRMPILLEESQFDAWMDPKASDAPLRAMLRPAPDDLLVADPASPLVNNVKNQGPELLGALLD